MGLNQASSFKKRFYHVKIKSLEVAGLQELGQQMGQLQRQAFRKTYGKIWDLAMIEVSVQAVASLTQYYDQLIRSFMFRDFQLVPFVEEFKGILEGSLGGLVLSIRQLGYPMRGAPSEKSIAPFIAPGFNDPNARILQRV